jgi:hypothetical protein
MIFTIDKNISNKNLLDNNTNYPFLSLKDLNGNYNSITFCIDADSNISIYQLENTKNNKSPSLISKMSISELGVILPLLINCEIKDLKEYMIFSIKDVNGWKKEAIDKIIDNITLAEKDKDLPLMHFNKDPFNISVNLIFNRYIYKMCDLNLLLSFIKKTFSISEFNQVKSLLKAFENRLGPDFNCQFFYMQKYCILRELICLVTGKHITIDPFTLNYIYSECTTLCKIGNYHSRLIKYKSNSGNYFIERRGPGWIDITSSIILSNGLVIDPRSFSRHDAKRPDQAAVSSEEEKEIKNLFAFNVSHSQEEKENIQYLMIDVDYTNLGHTLWNEVSGYIEFILICKDSNLINKKTVPVLPQSIPTLFSKIGIRSSFFQYIKKALSNQTIKNSSTDIITDYVNSISDSQIIINKIFIKNQPLSFRFPKISSLLSNTIRNDFTHVKNKKIHIYKNIRFHNKSQLNTSECLSQLFEDLEKQEDVKLKPYNIEIDLEFNSQAVYGPSFQARDSVNNTLSEIKTLCDRYMVKLNLHDSYEIPELMQLVSDSDICIVAIGSGAILPTWIFNKITVMHANIEHYSQLEWWNQVGGIDNNNQFIIPQNAINNFSSGMLLYDNYKIDINAYSNTIINALKKILKKVYIYSKV